MERVKNVRQLDLFFKDGLADNLVDKNEVKVVGDKEEVISRDGAVCFLRIEASGFIESGEIKVAHNLRILADKFIIKQMFLSN